MARGVTANMARPDRRSASFRVRRSLGPRLAFDRAGLADGPLEQETCVQLATILAIWGSAVCATTAMLATPASADPIETELPAQFLVEVTVVRVRSRPPQGERDAAPGPLQRLEDPLARHLLPSTDASTDEADAFLRFALESLGEVLDVKVVAQKRWFAHGGETIRTVIDPTTVCGWQSMMPCRHVDDPDWPFAPLHIEVQAERVAGDAIDLRAAARLTTDHAPTDRDRIDGLRLRTRQGAPIGLWLSSSVPQEDPHAIGSLASQSGIIILLTPHFLGSAEALEELARAQLAAARARAEREPLRRRAVAGEMDFTCRRGLLHDIHLELSRHLAPVPLPRLRDRPRTEVPMFCSNGLPWEGAALGMLVMTCRDGELRSLPPGPPHPDTRCLAHRPDGTLYETTFGSAPRAPAAASPPSP